MVKTRCDLKSVRIGTKAPRKLPASNSSAGNSGRSSRKYEGGNSYFPRETPPWQKEITKFFPSNSGNDLGNSSSNSDNTGTELASEPEKEGTKSTNKA